MKTIRASEIGTYLYCARAWWYQQQGAPSSHQAEMHAGTELHRQHGRAVVAAGLTQTLAFIFFLAALLLMVAYCTARLL
ncbi:MAG: hypothetical protein ABWK53_13300 [Anaerolineales bacterium]